MTCTVSGALRDFAGDDLPNTVVEFRPQSGVVGIDGATRVPRAIRVTSSAAGQITVELEPGTYTAHILGSDRTLQFRVGVPDAASANLHDCINQAPAITPTILSDAVAARNAAQAAAASAEDDATAAANSAAAALASEQAADNSADAAAASELAADQDATAAAASALAAAASETDAENARDQTLAYMQSGYDAVYATKALANTGLAGLAEGDVVLVLADESRGGRTAVYAKTGGVYVFARYWPAPKRVYCDSINGNDANSGLLPDEAVQTPTAANALLADGDHLFLARNGIYYAANFSTKKHLTVRPYGSGRRPIFTAAREIPAVSWTLYSGNIYKATVVHDTATVGSADASFYCQFAMWDDKGDSFLPARLCGLRRVLTGASNGTANVNLATDIAAMTAGSFTVRRTGFDNTNPFTVSATSFDYYVWLADGADPSALTDRVIRFAEGRVTAAFGFGCDIEGVDFCRSASKDHVSGGTGSGSVGRVHDVRVIDASIHGNVLRCSTFTKYYAEKNPYATIGGAGNGLHLYRDQTIDGISRGAWCDDIEIVGFETGIHAHGNGSGVRAFETWELGNIKIRDCGLAFFPNELNADMHVKSLHVSGGYGSMANEGNRAISLANAVKLVVDDFSFYSQVGATASIQAIGAVAGGEVHIKNGWVYLDEASPGSTRAVAVGSGTIRLENVTVVNGPMFTTTFSANTNLIAIDCILGELNAPAASVTATNCQLQWGPRDLATIQATYAGVASDCLVPFYEQPFARTFTAGEIAFDSVGTADTTSGAAFFLATSSELEDRGNIVIAGADGSGNPLKVQRPLRNPANDGGGKFAYTCANIPSFPATVAGAAVTAAYTTRKPFQIAAGTARLNSDQAALRVSDATQFTAGQLIRLGNFARREAFGLFKVLSVVGDVVTLTEAVPWRLTPLSGSGGAGYYGASSVVTAANNPVIDVYFGFPIWLSSTGPSGVSGTITYATGGTLAFTALRGGQIGRLTPAAAQRGSAFGGEYVNAETGVFNAELAVNDGDSVSLSARILVEEYLPIWAGNPALDRLPVLRRGSILAKRKMGWRFNAPFGGVDGVYAP